LELTNTETVLLGLLSEGPMTPHQLQQEIQYRDMNFWTEISTSSIPELLVKLEKQGLVFQSNRSNDNNFLKATYSLSENGKNIFTRKIEKILSNVEHLRWQIDIGTYNCNLLPPKKVKDALCLYRTQLKEKIDGYKDLLKFLQLSKCPFHRLAIASRPIFLLEAELKWVDSFIEQLSLPQ